MLNKGQLKKKTISGLLWSFMELLSKQGIQLVIQIILARLLVPEHFGLIGMITIFVAISTSLVQSGLDQALIREKNPGQRDYSTVFFFNLFISVMIYIVMFFSAPAIANFFGEPQLISILRVVMLVVIINAFTVIQRVILIRNIDFKVQTKISIISASTAGVIAVLMALTGWGVWSLVAQQIITQVMMMILLSLSNRWRPSLTFDVQLFKKYFTFGYKLLLAGLIDTTYKNIYFVIIGRLYPVEQLGYYTTATKLRDTTSNSITQAIQRVTYPVLSKLQDDNEALTTNFKKLIQMTAFIMFPVMLGLIAIAPNLIPFLLGDQWAPSVIYFQLLSIVGMLYPLHAINLNILKVQNRSDLFLLLEIIKKTASTIFIIMAVLLGLGIVGLIYASIATSIFALFINTYYSAREINYPIWSQLKNMFPSLMVAFFMASAVYSLNYIFEIHILLLLVLQIATGIFIYIGVSWLFKLKEFKIFFDLIRDLKNNRKQTEEV